MIFRPHYLPIFISALLLSFSLMTRLEAGEGRRIAVLVGVRDFQERARFPSLPYAVRDIVRLYEALDDPRLGRFDEIYVLADADALNAVAKEWPELMEVVERIQEKGRLHPARLLTPMRANVDATLTALQETTGQDDTVLMQFSTHGTVAEGVAQGLRISSEKMVYVLADTRLDKDQRFVKPLTQAQVLDKLDEFKARNTLLWEATCHNAWQRIKSKGLNSFQRSVIGRRTVIMADSSPGQTASEDARLEAGVVTHFMLEALRAPENPGDLAALDLNGDEAISLEEAFSYVEGNTRAYTRRLTGATAQTPFFSDTRVGTPAPLILSGRPRAGGERPSFFYLSPITLAGEHDNTLVKRSIAMEGAEISVEGNSSTRPVPLTPGIQALTLREEREGEMAPEIETRRLWLEIHPGDQLNTSQVLQRLAERNSFTAALGVGVLAGPVSWGGATLELSLDRTVLSRPRGERGLSVGLKGILGGDAGCNGLEGCRDAVSSVWLSQQRLFSLQARVIGTLRPRPDLLIWAGPQLGVTSARLTWLEPIAEGYTRLEVRHVAGPEAGITFGLAVLPRIQLFWKPREGNTLRAIESGWWTVSGSLGVAGLPLPYETLIESPRVPVLQAGAVAGWRRRF